MLGGTTATAAPVGRNDVAVDDAEAESEVREAEEQEQSSSPPPSLGGPRQEEQPPGFLASAQVRIAPFGPRTVQARGRGAAADGADGSP